MLGRGFDNALVGLVRHNPIDFIHADTGLCNHFFRHFGQCFHGKLKHARAVHFHIRVATNFAAGHMRRHFQQTQMRAVGLQFTADNAGLV